ncbi:hypothetical protein ACL02S_05765 [Nocardia sp. 004]|uniref:hypothetical protein n=1 Tax=Nocardia sp. 004 TaxID=3385978 RepID=UPI0039A08A90
MAITGLFGLYAVEREHERLRQWAARRSAHLDTLTPAGADSAEQSATGGGKVHTFHGMNPDSAARMVERIDARRELVAGAREVVTVADSFDLGASVQSPAVAESGAEGVTPPVVPGRQPLPIMTPLGWQLPKIASPGLGLQFVNAPYRSPKDDPDARTMYSVLQGQVEFWENEAESLSPDDPKYDAYRGSAERAAETLRDFEQNWAEAQQESDQGSSATTPDSSGSVGAGSQAPQHGIPDTSLLDMPDTTGHAPGDVWEGPMLDGRPVTYSIPEGNGTNTVDLEILNPNGTVDRWRIVRNERGGVKHWHDDANGHSSYASKDTAEDDWYFQSFAPGTSTSGAPSHEFTADAELKNIYTPSYDADGNFIGLDIGVLNDEGLYDNQHVDQYNNTTFTDTVRDPGGGYGSVLTGQVDNTGHGWKLDKNDQLWDVLPDENGKSMYRRYDPETKEYSFIYNHGPNLRVETHNSSGRVVNSKTFGPDGKLLSTLQRVGGLFIEGKLGEDGEFVYDFINEKDGRSTSRGTLEYLPGGGMLLHYDNGKTVEVDADGNPVDTRNLLEKAIDLDSSIRGGIRDAAVESAIGLGVFTGLLRGFPNLPTQEEAADEMRQGINTAAHLSVEAAKENAITYVSYQQGKMHIGEAIGEYWNNSDEALNEYSKLLFGTDWNNFSSDPGGTLGRFGFGLATFIAPGPKGLGAAGAGAKGAAGAGRTGRVAAESSGASSRATAEAIRNAATTPDAPSAVPFPSPREAAIGTDIKQGISQPNSTLQPNTTKGNPSHPPAETRIADHSIPDKPSSGLSSTVRAAVEAEITWWKEIPGRMFEGIKREVSAALDNFLPNKLAADGVSNATARLGMTYPSRGSIGVFKASIELGEPPIRGFGPYDFPDGLSFTGEHPISPVKNSDARATHRPDESPEFPSLDDRKHGWVTQADEQLKQVGINPADIYGDLPANHPGRARMSSVLATTSFAKDAHGMLEKAAQFAAEKSTPGNPWKFANAYEYAHAKFGQFRSLLDYSPKRATESNNAYAARMFDLEYVRAALAEDLKIVESSGGNAQRIDPTLRGDQLDAAVREVDNLGFDDPVGAAYHAIKHRKEIPKSELADKGMIVGYLDSAAETVRTGTIPFPHELEAATGAIKILFHRTVGSEGAILEAIVKVERDGTVRIASYGHRKVGKK